MKPLENIRSMDELREKALELVRMIGDEELQRYTVMCMEVLATGDLARDFDRSQRAANAVMHEFHKEVSEALLNAIAINLALGAYSIGSDEGQKHYEKLFALLQSDRPLIEAVIHLASYSEVLAPSVKREAEAITAQINEQGALHPAPDPKNRS